MFQPHAPSKTSTAARSKIANVGAVVLMQVIKDLYKGFPERMGKKLAERRQVGGAIPVEEALRREMDVEKAYLRDVEGMDEAGIKRCASKRPSSARARNVSTFLA